MLNGITIDKLTSFTHSTIFIPSSQSLDSLAQSSPLFLRNIWSQVGWSSWHDGAFWLCNPRDFKKLTAKIFSAVSVPEDFICFGYDAIGRYLHYWHRVHGIILIDTIAGDILLLGRGCCGDDDGSYAIAEHLFQTISLAAPWMDHSVTTTISALIDLYGSLSSNEIYNYEGTSTKALNSCSGTIRNRALDVFNLRTNNLELLVVPDIDRPGAPNYVRPVTVIAESCLVRD